MLQGFGCDCQFEVVNWRIRCSLYSSHDSSELRFFVSIFRSPQPGQFVVEMQKRVGDSITFVELYHKFQRAMQQDPANDTLSAVSYQTHSSFQLPELPELQELQAPSEVDIQQLVQCLLSMSQSKYTDVQRSGICSLVELACDSHFTGGLLAAGVPEFFVRQLDSDHEETRRSCLSGIANMFKASGASCTKFASDSNLLIPLLKTARNQELVGLHSKRELIRALIELSPHMRGLPGQSDFEVGMECLEGSLPSTELQMLAVARSQLVY